MIESVICYFQDRALHHANMNPDTEIVSFSNSDPFFLIDFGLFWLTWIDSEVPESLEDTDFL